MTKKEQDIQNARKVVGWAYNDFRWVTDKEAAMARKEREELLEFLRDKVNRSFSGTKIHTGPLSQGCRLCGEGFWSCVFINQSCTADCFFCPQNRKIKKEELPYTVQGITFRDMEDYVDFLAYAHYKGVGFSGGEPLLAFDKLLAYIKKIRERSGDNLYLWVYTNGDLAEKEKLLMLQEYGLNEIRFNISARNYKLESVERAVGIIDTVTIEIPVIPEDYETVRRSLPRMQDLGVSHVNLHQLLATMYNYKEFIARNYSFLHQNSITILESELTALRLMKYAVENNMTLPINYCNSFYKSEFQTKGNRERIASLVKEDCEELTETGYIRRLAIRREGDESAESVIRGPVLRTLDPSGCNLVISYFEPGLKSVLASPEAGQASSPHLKAKIFAERTLSDRLELAGAAAISGFRQLILEKKDETEVRRNLLENCQVKTWDDLKRLMETINRIISLKKFEHTGSGFPDIY